MPDVSSTQTPQAPFARAALGGDYVRHNQTLVDTLLSITDMSSAVADALDSIGNTGATLSAAMLQPVVRETKLCGPAVTLKYARVLEGHREAKERGGASMGYGELCASSSPRDIAVIDCDGDSTAAVLGGLTASRIKLADLDGCVVNGAVRDVASLEKLQLPVWALGHNPKSGLHEFRVVAINERVHIGSASVAPGDYIVADKDGLCVVPNAVFPQVVSICVEAEAAEAEDNRLLSTCSTVQEFDVALRAYKRGGSQR